jgi:hypothetical protein
VSITGGRREKGERGKARVTSGIQVLWWTARISNTGSWDEKTSGRYIGFPHGEEGETTVAIGFKLWWAKRGRDRETAQPIETII